MRIVNFSTLLLDIAADAAALGRAIVTAIERLAQSVLDWIHQLCTTVWRTYLSVESATLRVVAELSLILWNARALAALLAVGFALYSVAWWPLFLVYAATLILAVLLYLPSTFRDEKARHLEELSSQVAALKKLLLWPWRIVMSLTLTWVLVQFMLPHASLAIPRLAEESQPAQAPTGTAKPLVDRAAAAPDSRPSARPPSQQPSPDSDRHTTTTPVEHGPTPVAVANSPKVRPSYRLQLTARGSTIDPNGSYSSSDPRFSSGDDLLISVEYDGAVPRHTQLSIEWYLDQHPVSLFETVTLADSSGLWSRTYNNATVAVGTHRIVLTVDGVPTHELRFRIDRK